PPSLYSSRSGRSASSSRGMSVPRRLALRAAALGYLIVILLAPLVMVFYRTFQNGLEPIWQTLSDPNTIHAFQVTLIATALADPLNTVFGILCRLALVRR